MKNNLNIKGVVMLLYEWIEGSDSVEVDYFDQRKWFAFDLFLKIHILSVADKSLNLSNKLFREYQSGGLSNVELESIELVGGIFLLGLEDDSILINAMEPFARHDYDPDKDEFEVKSAFHAAALFNFYKKLSKENRYYNVHLKKLHQIDLSMAKFAREIGRRESFLVLEFNRTDQIKERTGKSSIAKKIRKAMRKQKAIELYYTIESRSKLRPYTIAKMIRERWKKRALNEPVPSTETIVRYIRDYKSKK